MGARIAKIKYPSKVIELPFPILLSWSISRVSPCSLTVFVHKLMKRKCVFCTVIIPSQFDKISWTFCVCKEYKEYSISILLREALPVNEGEKCTNYCEGTSSTRKLNRQIKRFLLLENCF